MKLPNKVTSYEESVLSKLNIILDILNNKDIPLLELYESTRDIFPDIKVFIDTIDCLFALNKIKFNDFGGITLC